MQGFWRAGDRSRCLIDLLLHAGALLQCFRSPPDPATRPETVGDRRRGLLAASSRNIRAAGMVDARSIYDLLGPRLYLLMRQRTECRFQRKPADQARRILFPESMAGNAESHGSRARLVARSVAIQFIRRSEQG